METLLSTTDTLLLFTFLAILISVIWSIYNKHRLGYWYLDGAARKASIKWWHFMQMAILVILFAVICYGYMGFDHWKALINLGYIGMIIYTFGSILLNIQRKGIKQWNYRGTNLLDKLKYKYRFILLAAFTVLAWLFSYLFKTVA